MRRSFNFKGQTATTAEILAEVEVGGQTVTIVKGSYEKGGQTYHTIVLRGVGKETRLGPQKALAILQAGDEIERYFREVGVIE